MITQSISATPRKISTIYIYCHIGIGHLDLPFCGILTLLLKICVMEEVTSSNLLGRNGNGDADEELMLALMRKMEDMKRQRAEDARANEKVAAMFAAQRQVWVLEKQKLQTQIDYLSSHNKDSYVKRECEECVKKERIVNEIENDFVKVVDLCREDMKAVEDEKAELEHRFNDEILKLKKEVEDRDDIICCLMRNKDDRDDLKSEMVVVENLRSLGIWNKRFEKHLHSVNIKQRHLQEIDAFERQIKAKDERMEVFRHKLISMDRQIEDLRCEKQQLIQCLEKAETLNRNLEVAVRGQERELRSLKEKLGLEINCGIKRIGPRIEHRSAMADQNFLGTVPFQENSDQKNNEHVICLIQQATRAFSPCGRTFSHGEVPSNAECCNDDDEEAPVLVDKHVSDACKCGASSEDCGVGDGSVKRKLQFEKGSDFVEEENSCLMISKEEKGKSVLTVPLQPEISTTKGEKQSMDQNKTHSPSGKQFFPNREDHKAHHDSPSPSGKYFSPNKEEKAYHDSFLNSVIEGFSVAKNDVEAQLISKVKSLEQQLIQLEKMSKVESRMFPSEMGSEAMKDRQERHFNGSSVPTVQHLKKQVRRYQIMIGKINNLHTRIDYENPSYPKDGAKSKEEAAKRESQLMEAFQLQHYLGEIGQKLKNLQVDNFGIMNNGTSIHSSMFGIQKHLQEIQRSLEIGLARIVGKLEGMLARDGIMHVIPLDWKKWSQLPSRDTQRT